MIDWHQDGAQRTAILLWVLVLVAACKAPPEPQVLQQGGGIWLAGASIPSELGLDRAGVGALEELGLSNWFLDGGQILGGGRWEGAIGRGPEGAKEVHLVFRMTDGSLLDSSLADTTNALRARVLDVQNRGARVAGALLDVSELRRSEPPWQQLESFRDDLVDLTIGLRVPASTQPAEASQWVGRVFDYVAVDAYGQAFGTIENHDAWEIGRTAAVVRQWRESDVPVLPIVWLGGRAEISVPSGVTARRRHSPRFPREVIALYSGSVNSEFSFEGFDRQQLEFKLPRRTEVRIAGSTGHLPAGTHLSIQRPTRTHLSRLLQGLRAGVDESLQARSPVLLAGLAQPEDGIGLGLADLRSSMGDGLGTLPVLELDVDYQASRRVIEVQLGNRGEATGIGVLQHNFVEVLVTGTTVRSVNPGTFSRYRLAENAFDDSSPRMPARLPRSPRIVRLYHPLVEREQTLGGARLILEGRPEAIEVTARFRDAIGGDVTSAWVWPEPTVDVPGEAPDRGAAENGADAEIDS